MLNTRFSLLYASVYEIFLYNVIYHLFILFNCNLLSGMLISGRESIEIERITAASRIQGKPAAFTTATHSEFGWLL